MLGQTIPYNVQTPIQGNGNGHNGNGHSEPTSTEIVASSGGDVQAQRRVAEIPDYAARLVDVSAVLGYTRQLRALFRPALASIRQEYPGQLGEVLYNQDAVALVHEHARSLQDLTGVAMPGTWPPPQPEPPVVVEVPDNGLRRQIRGILNGYGDCDTQNRHKLSEIRRLTSGS